MDVAPTTITTGNRPFGTVGGSDARDDGEGDDDDEMVDETIPLTPRETFSSPIIATLGRNNRPSGSAPGSFPGVDRHNHPQYTNHNPPRRTPASTSASLGYYLSFFRSPSTSTMEGDGAESECSSVPAPLLSSWLPRRNTNTTATPGSRQTNDLASTERNNHYDHHRPCLSYVSRAGNTYPHTTEPPPSTPSQGTDTALEPWYPSEDDDNHDDYYYDDDSYYNYYQNSMANRDASHQYWPNQDRDDTGSSMGIGIDTSRVDTGSQHESHSQDQSEKQHGNDDDEDGQDDGRSRHDEENPWTRSQSRVSIATYQETHPWHRELLRTVGEEVETWYEYVLQRSFRRASAAPPLSPDHGIYVIYSISLSNIKRKFNSSPQPRVSPRSPWNTMTFAWCSNPKKYTPTGPCSWISVWNYSDWKQYKIWRLIGIRSTIPHRVIAGPVMMIWVKPIPLNIPPFPALRRYRRHRHRHPHLRRDRKH